MDYIAIPHDLVFSLSILTAHSIARSVKHDDPVAPINRQALVEDLGCATLQLELLPNLVRKNPSVFVIRPYPEVVVFGAIRISSNLDA